MSADEKKLKSQSGCSICKNLNCVCEKKLREFWIFSENGYQDHVAWVKPQHKDTWKYVHVIEYSAYETLEKQKQAMCEQMWKRIDDMQNFIEQQKVEITRLEAERDRYKFLYEDYSLEVEELQLERDQLRSDLQIVVEALEYVNRVTYGTESCNTDEENNEILARHFFNSADRARETLKKIKVVK